MKIEDEESGKCKRKEKMITKVLHLKEKNQFVKMESMGNRRPLSYFQFSVVILIVGFSDTISYVTNLLDI